MPTTASLITAALAPGVALTAIVFYNTALQNRLMYITGRIRDLNREARDLREKPGDHKERLASTRWQVDLMNKRSLMMRRAILLAYGGFFCFVATVLELAGSLHLAALERVAVYSFTAGFLFILAAAVLSAIEMYIAQRTMDEDIRTSQ